MLTNPLNLFREPKLLLTSWLCPLWVVPLTLRQAWDRVRMSLESSSPEGRTGPSPGQSCSGNLSPSWKPAARRNVHSAGAHVLSVGDRGSVTQLLGCPGSRLCPRQRTGFASCTQTGLKFDPPTLTYSGKLSCKMVYTALDRNILLHTLNYGHFLSQEPPAPPALQFQCQGSVWLQFLGNSKSALLPGLHMLISYLTSQLFLALPSNQDAVHKPLHLKI